MPLMVIMGRGLEVQDEKFTLNLSPYFPSGCSFLVVVRSPVAGVAMKEVTITLKPVDTGCPYWREYDNQRGPVEICKLTGDECMAADMSKCETRAKQNGTLPCPCRGGN